MKKQFLTGIAVVLLLTLAACQYPPITAVTGNAHTPSGSTPPQTITTESILPQEPSTGDTQPAEPAPAAPKQAKGNQLTKEQAISKALAHAGLKESQVSRLSAQLDQDDGVTLYEVEFETATYEYDYEVHATSGKILKAEKERND